MELPDFWISIKTQRLLKLNLSNPWNLLGFTGANILRTMVQNGPNTMSNHIIWGQICINTLNLSMVFIDLDTDLIDYRKVPGMSVFSKIVGNFPEECIWKFTEIEIPT